MEKLIASLEGTPDERALYFQGFSDLLPKVALEHLKMEIEALENIGYTVDLAIDKEVTFISGKEKHVFYSCSITRALAPWDHDDDVVSIAIDRIGSVLLVKEDLSPTKSTIFLGFKPKIHIRDGIEYAVSNTYHELGINGVQFRSHVEKNLISTKAIA